MREAGVELARDRRSAGDMPAGRDPTRLLMKLAARSGVPSFSHLLPSSCACADRVGVHSEATAPLHSGLHEVNVYPAWPSLLQLILSA